MSRLNSFKSALCALAFSLFLGTNETSFAEEPSQPASIFFVGGKILFRAESNSPTFELVGASQTKVSKPVYRVLIKLGRRGLGSRLPQGSGSRLPQGSVKVLKNLELVEQSVTDARLKSD